MFLRVEPLPRGSGFEFVDQVKGGTIPGQFMPAVEKGVRQALEGGVVAGYPVMDVRVIVYDGKHHSVDSKEIAFATAGKKAFMAAVREARPGRAGAHRQRRDHRARVSTWATSPATWQPSAARSAARPTAIAGQVVVRGLVPMSELAGYQSRLNAMTSGQGRYTLESSPLRTGAADRAAAAHRAASRQG